MFICGLRSADRPWPHVFQILQDVAMIVLTLRKTCNSPPNFRPTPVAVARSRFCRSHHSLLCNVVISTSLIYSDPVTESPSISDYIFIDGKYSLSSLRGNLFTSDDVRYCLFLVQCRFLCVCSPCLDSPYARVRSSLNIPPLIPGGLVVSNFYAQ